MSARRAARSTVPSLTPVVRNDPKLSAVKASHMGSNAALEALLAVAASRSGAASASWSTTYVPGPALTAPGGTATPSIHAERAKAQSADFGLTVLALKAVAAAACSMRSAMEVS